MKRLPIKNLLLLVLYSNGIPLHGMLTQKKIIINKVLNSQKYCKAVTDTLGIKTAVSGNPRFDRDLFDHYIGRSRIMREEDQRLKRDVWFERITSKNEGKQ